MSNSNPGERKGEHIPTRGQSHSDLPGTLTFVGLRLLDPLLQYSIIAHGTGSYLINLLGGSVLSNPSPAVLTNTGLRLIDSLDLTPHRLVLVGMAVGAALKHAIWKTFVGVEPMPLPAALIVSTFNTVNNTINSLLFIAAATSAARYSGEAFKGWPLLLGCGVFTIGLLMEFVSEVQRKTFKDKPENKGKVHNTGVFGLCRHPNYGGYTLWRTGFALAASGPVAAAAVFAFFFYDFSCRGVPVLDEYCQERYKEQWTQYKKDVPYKLIPYIY